VVTKIKLEKAENEAGIAYGKMLFSLDRVLTPKEQDVLQPYQEKMEQMLAPLAIVSADYDTAEEVPAGPQGLRSYPRGWTDTPEPEDAAEPEPEPENEQSKIPF
jgi:hypothetical protein